MIKTCCVTGHRDISADLVGHVKQELRKEVMQAVADGYTNFASGFAEGVDLFFAAIIVELKQKNTAIMLEAAIPYRNRLMTKDIEFQRLIKACDFVRVHSESYSQSCFMKRNREMVLPSQRVIAVYDGREKGGSFFTMRYAYSQEKEVRLIRI